MLPELWNDKIWTSDNIYLLKCIINTYIKIVYSLYTIPKFVVSKIFFERNYYFYFILIDHKWQQRNV